MAVNFIGGSVTTEIDEFEVSVEITRPANTTAYTINDIVNGSSDYLPTLDFGITNAGRKIQINSATLLSNNGGASTKLNAVVHLFNASTLTGQSHVDNTAFNPTYAELKAKGATFLDGVYNTINYGSNAYQVFQTEVQRNATLDATGKLYPAIIATNTYTPASGEKITLTLKGYLL